MAWKTAKEKSLWVPPARADSALRSATITRAQGGYAFEGPLVFGRFSYTEAEPVGLLIEITSDVF